MSFVFNDFFDVCFVSAIWHRLSGTALSFRLEVGSCGFRGMELRE